MNFPEAELHNMKKLRFLILLHIKQNGKRIQLNLPSFSFSSFYRGCSVSAAFRRRFAAFALAGGFVRAATVGWARIL